ncbi:hypothetical protein HDU67_009474 [Dinochytrium kinnereticum]|nr:hypothetical protein HDU67_009474 [Dinochytrium kinnereticum]
MLTLTASTIVTALAAAQLASALPGGSQPGSVGSGALTIVSDAEVQELRGLAQLSQLSYCANRPNLARFDCNICNGPASTLTQFQPIISTNNATQGYIALDEPNKTIYLSFQGAVNPENWVSSFNLPRTRLKYADPDTDAYVHQGFQSAYETNEVRTKTIDAVTKMLEGRPDFSLHALGHSYGCPISTLAVADLINSNTIAASMVSLTTFGCPRMGNYAFARLIDTELGLFNVRRVVHSYDRLTRNPPTTFGYRHSGKEMFVDVERKQMLSCLDIKEGLDESPSCNNRFDVNALSIDPHNSYFDHTQNSACVAVDSTKPISVGYLPFTVLTSRP